MSLITDPLRLSNSAKCVEFHGDWLIKHSDPMPGDGQDAEPGPEKLSRMRECLDFALVRLSEPVGLQSRTAMGGEALVGQSATTART